MLNSQEQTRLYEFSHDVGRPSWEVETHTFLLNVSYPDASAGMTEGIAGENVILRNIHPGMTIDHHFYPYTISTVVNYANAIGLLTVTLDFSSPVEIEERSEGMLIISDGSGHELLSLIPSRPRDDTGMMGPAPGISVTGEGGNRRIEVTIDDTWMRDTSRVFPVLLPIDYSLTPPTEAMRAVRLMAIADQTVLYRDTRPESSTQFHVGFYDDYEFRRPRPQFEGKPACSTVPTVLPNTVVSASAEHQTDITQEDANRYQNGNGYPRRTVWLRFIASKDISSNTPVYYDIDTPGTADFNGNIAEPAGSLDGLPMFRGSFDVNQESPPSSQDGTGRLYVYIQERRLRDMGCRMTVRGMRANDLTSKATVLFGHAGVWPLPLSAQVIQFPKLPMSIRVVGNSGVWGRGGKVRVLQLTPPGELLTDSRFRSSSLFATQWDTPVAHVVSGRPAYDSGTMIWADEEQVFSSDYATSYLNPAGDAYVHSFVIGEMTSAIVPIFDVRIATGLRITLEHRVIDMLAGYGSEWVDGSTQSGGPILDITVSGLGAGAGTLTLSIGSDVMWETPSAYAYSYTIPAASLVAVSPSTLNISDLHYYSGYSYGFLRDLAYPFTEEQDMSRRQRWTLGKLAITAVTP